MFSDSEIAKKFACGHTKKPLPLPLHDMSSFYSVMMDESNDKIDKSCIILVRVFTQM